MELIQKVKEMIASQLKIEAADIQDNALLVDDLQADSLDFVELAMDFEDEFGIVVADDDVSRLRTVKDIVDYLEEQM